MQTSNSPSKTTLTEVVKQPPLLFLDTEEPLHSLSLLNDQLLERSHQSPASLQRIVSTYLKCLDPATILGHPSNHIPNHGLQGPLLIMSSCKTILQCLQANPELYDLASSIRSRQIPEDIEGTNLCMILIPHTSNLLLLSPCLILCVLELFIECTHRHCPKCFVIALVVNNTVRLMFKRVAQALDLLQATNILCQHSVQQQHNTRAKANLAFQVMDPIPQYAHQNHHILVRSPQS
jgi:hypothetical protein